MVATHVWKKLLLAAMVVGFLGCPAPGSGDCSVTGVSVVASSANVTTGQSVTLTATLESSGACSGVTWSASPDGGTVTPTGLTATFVASSAGAFTVTATSADDAAHAGSATVTAVACGTANGTVVVHGANISASETWAGDNVTHSIPNSINILAPATVTVQPCAIVLLASDASITVNGNVGGAQDAKLIAAGESNLRFVTFDRADLGQPWGILRGYNERSFIELHHALVRGGGSFGGQYRNPAIAMNGPGYGVLPKELLAVDDVVVDNPVGAGIYLDANAAFTAASNDLTFEHTPDYLFVVTMMALGSLPSGQYFSLGNALPETLIQGPNANVFASMTVHKRLPIRIQTASMSIVAFGADTSPVTLTVDPGVTFHFAPLAGPAPGARVIFGSNGNAPNNKVGALVAMGTEAEPIVFTSGASVPAAGDWVGLWLNTATGSRLDHVVIEYAGGENGISSSNCRPDGSEDEAALVVGDLEDQYIPPADLITHSVIAHSAAHGINSVWVGGTFAPNLTVAGNANTFTSVPGCNQTLNRLSGAPCSMMGCQP